MDSNIHRIKALVNKYFEINFLKLTYLGHSRDCLKFPNYQLF